MNIPNQIEKIKHQLDQLSQDITDLSLAKHTIDTHDFSNALIQFRIYLEKLDEK